MSSICKKAKKVLGIAIQETDQRKAQFLRCPDKDFSRKRKLPFSKMLRIMIGLAGGSLTNELMDFFHCSPQMASSSAFIQQRAKIKPEAFEFLFHQFSDRISSNNLWQTSLLLSMLADNSSREMYPRPPLKLSFPGIFHLSDQAGVLRGKRHRKTASASSIE